MARVSDTRPFSSNELAIREPHCRRYLGNMASATFLHGWHPSGNNGHYCFHAKYARWFGSFWLVMPSIAREYRASYCAAHITKCLVGNSCNNSDRHGVEALCLGDWALDARFDRLTFHPRFQAADEGISTPIDMSLRNW